MSSEIEKWVNENLSKMLDLPDAEELTQYVLQMQNEDLYTYLMSLLNYENEEHKQFIAELKKRQAAANSGYKKRNQKNRNKNGKKPNKEKKEKGKTTENIQQEEFPKVEKTEKKKTKFVNLYSEEGRDRSTILLPGRHKCSCEAKRHALINNCLNCGRIVCVQEGSGPCFFCDEIVCSVEQQAILASNTKRADQLYNKLKCQKANKSVEDSIKLRDKLLENDHNSARCTRVIDDESDYYQLNSTWLSSAERDKLQKLEEEMSAKKHASRLNRKITVDFTGREIVEEEEPPNVFDEQQFQELCESIPFDNLDNPSICPTIEFDRPTYTETGIFPMHAMERSNVLNTTNRIQDKEFLEVTDNGLCLSMHQPYASLLVSGIKIHEGRTWYTPHRGRLWIASGSKVPSTEEIRQMQEFYRSLRNEKIIFPEHYPTGCLLGCVTVKDVLPQEEYRKQYPDGENESPYILICENPYVLPIKFPLQGKHKIYKLEPKIHQAAVKSLEKMLKDKHNKLFDP